ncbi:MAG: hypothetical protein FJX67_01930 [Alphaproteobacteria bacterium]|nr:hypothetical protein [Alphaproteobacteria bacterium]
MSNRLEVPVTERMPIRNDWIEVEHAAHQARAEAFAQLFKTMSNRLEAPVLEAPVTERTLIRNDWIQAERIARQARAEAFAQMMRRLFARLAPTPSKARAERTPLVPRYISGVL